MEKWKEIKGYEGYYEVSNMGNVRSMSRYVNHHRGGKRLMKGRPRALGDNGNGYLFVPLTKEGRSKNTYVHRLVAEAFLIKSDKQFVNHINGDKTDNRVDNLEWCTRRENMSHAKENGLMNYGEKHHNTRLTNIQAGEIRAMWHICGFSMSKIAEIYNCSSSAVWRIVNNRSFTR